MTDIAAFIAATTLFVFGLWLHKPKPRRPTRTARRQRRRKPYHYRGGGPCGPTPQQLAEQASRRREIPEAYREMPGMTDWIENGR